MSPFYVIMLFTALARGCSAYHWDHIFGVLDKKTQIPIDIAMDRDIMIVTLSTPEHAPKYFRETTNFHVFSKGFVALKDEQEKICFVKPFNETYENMSQRVQKSKTGESKLEVKQILIDLTGKPILKPSEVRDRFGVEIASFCSLYDVFAINDDTQAHPQERLPVIRRKRRVAGRVMPPGDYIPDPTGWLGWPRRPITWPFKWPITGPIDPTGPKGPIIVC